MTITIQSKPPKVGLFFDKDLLSKPLFKFSSKILKRYADWIYEKINQKKYKKYPKTLEELKNEHQKFMELYERAKTQEQKDEEKKASKAKILFYAPYLSNKNDRAIYRRLEHRMETSIDDRRNNKI